ncbi:hypothetical protein FGB62_14g283 [Gracilaria domingensis]|nr:hypothetical protein FGB62_14g283 [Gracilaria domingensis]
MAVIDASKPEKKNKATASEGASESSRKSTKAISKETRTSRSVKTKTCCQKKGRSRVPESKSGPGSISPRSTATRKSSPSSPGSSATTKRSSSSSGSSATSKRSSIAAEDKYQSKKSVEELEVNPAAKTRSNLPGLGAKDGPSIAEEDKQERVTSMKEMELEAALKTVGALGLGATEAGCSTTKKVTVELKARLMELMLQEVLQTAGALELGSKATEGSTSDKSRSKRKKKKTWQLLDSVPEVAAGSEGRSAKIWPLSTSDSHKSSSGKQNGGKAGPETAICCAGLPLNDTQLSIAGSKSTKRVVEDCKFAQSSASSKARSPTGNGSGLSDELVTGSLAVGNSVKDGCPQGI